jgi:hypothetical protein
MDSFRIKVRKGDSLGEAWKRLVEWVESLRIIPNDDVTIKYTPNGTLIKVHKKDQWLHPWRVSVDDKFVKVTTGTVNGIVPFIKTDGKWVQMDNYIGGEYQYKKPTPVMDFDVNKHKKGLSYILLKVKHSASAGGFEVSADGETGEVIVKDDVLRIVQEDSYVGPKDGKHAYYPLAMVRVHDRVVQDMFQIAHHNLGFNFQERDATKVELEKDPDKKKIGRAIFHPL